MCVSVCCAAYFENYISALQGAEKADVKRDLDYLRFSEMCNSLSALAHSGFSSFRRQCMERTATWRHMCTISVLILTLTLTLAPNIQLSYVSFLYFRPSKRSAFWTATVWSVDKSQSALQCRVKVGIVERLVCRHALAEILGGPSLFFSFPVSHPLSFPSFSFSPLLSPVSLSSPSFPWNPARHQEKRCKLHGCWRSPDANEIWCAESSKICIFWLLFRYASLYYKNIDKCHEIKRTRCTAYNT